MANRQRRTFSRSHRLLALALLRLVGALFLAADLFFAFTRTP